LARGHRIAGGILALALHAPARVLGLGKGAQELVLQAGGLGAHLLQLGDKIELAGLLKPSSDMRSPFCSGGFPVDIPRVSVS
jgi:hypothetical protein